MNVVAIAALGALVFAASSASAQLPATLPPSDGAADGPVIERDDRERDDPRSARVVQGGRARVVGDHHFITPLVGPSALIPTAAELTQGFTVLDIAGSELLAYQQYVDLQAALFDRVALDLRGAAVAAVNDERTTLLAVAGAAEIDLSATAKVRLFTLDRVGLQVTAGFGMGYARDVVLVPIRLLAELAEADSLETFLADFRSDDLFIENETGRATPSVSAAWGLGPVGLQAAVAPSYVFASTDLLTGRNDPSGSVAMSGQLELDVMSLGEVVPLALTFEYGLDHGFGDDDPVVHQLVAGAWYAGRRDFNVGFAANGSFRDDVETKGGVLSLRYYF